MSNVPVKVPNTPYLEQPPVMPRMFRMGTDDEGKPIQVPFCEETKDWLESARTIPHARIWGKADWYKLNRLAILVDLVNTGEDVKAATMNQISQMEKALWLTKDSQVGKVIYVDDDDAASTALASPAAAEAMAEDAARFKALVGE